MGIARCIARRREVDSWLTYMLLSSVCGEASRRHSAGLHPGTRTTLSSVCGPCDVGGCSGGNPIDGGTVSLEITRWLLMLACSQCDWQTTASLFCRNLTKTLSIAWHRASKVVDARTGARLAAFVEMGKITMHRHVGPLTAVLDKCRSRPIRHQMMIFKCEIVCARMNDGRDAVVLMWLITTSCPLNYAPP